MTIEEAIARYLDHRQAQGLRRSTVASLSRRLRRVFESVLAEQLAILSADLVDELRARLGRQGKGGLLLGSTRELLWRTTRSFLLWCVQQRLLTTNPLAPRRVQHIGEVVRRLREDAGLSRQDLAVQTGLSLPTLRRFEMTRLNLSREELLRLLRHAVMESLPDRVKAAGLDLGLGNNGIGKP